MTLNLLVIVVFGNRIFTDSEVRFRDFAWRNWALRVSWLNMGFRSSSKSDPCCSCRDVYWILERPDRKYVTSSIYDIVKDSSRWGKNKCLRLQIFCDPYLRTPSSKSQDPSTKASWTSLSELRHKWRYSSRYARHCRYWGSQNWSCEKRQDEESKVHGRYRSILGQPQVLVRSLERLGWQNRHTRTSRLQELNKANLNVNISVKIASSVRLTFLVACTWEIGMVEKTPSERKSIDIRAVSEQSISVCQECTCHLHIRTVTWREGTRYGAPPQPIRRLSSSKEDVQLYCSYNQQQSASDSNTTAS